MSYPIRSKGKRFVVVGAAPDRRLCSDCVHGDPEPGGGIHCAQLSELILNEAAAETCDLFEKGA